MSLRWLGSRGAAAILVAAALVALTAVARGRISDTDGRILLSLAALLYFGGAALAGFAVIDRVRSFTLGRATISAAAVGLGLGLWGIWSFVWEGDNELSSKAAWSGTLTILALLMATTSRLLANGAAPTRFAAIVGAVAGLAATLSVVGVWAEPDAGAFVKLIFALWIVAVVGFFLVPVASRWSAADVAEVQGERVLAALDDVELIAVRGAHAGGVDVRLASGERVMLRRRADQSDAASTVP